MMKFLKYLGAGLLIVGALTLAVTSGAFDAIDANRGVSVESAGDDSALLTLEYHDAYEGGTVELHSDAADQDGGCIFGACSSYQYNEEEIVLFVDNTSSGDLGIDETDLTVDVDNDAIVGGAELRHEPADDGIRVVLADFRCPTEYNFLGPYPQGERSATLAVTVEASSPDLTIDMEREIDVECVPEE